MGARRNFRRGVGANPKMPHMRTKIASPIYGDEAPPYKEKVAKRPHTEKRDPICRNK